MIQPALFPEATITGDADISACGHYRWSLMRRWGEPSGRFVGWLMLNPSKATATENDPTIRRCISFAQAWGFDGLIVRNLFNLRATDPRELYKHESPVGDLEKANQMVISLFDSCELVIAAWGVHGSLRCRDREVQVMLARADKQLHCLKRTKDGHPTHPLYLARDTQPVPFGLEMA